MMVLRRTLLFSFGILVSLPSCTAAPEIQKGKLSIGVIAYGEQSRSLDQYTEFTAFLAQQTHSVIELEPALNERRALEQIRRQVWSLVFASPGIAAIAIDQHQYLPIFAAQGGNLLRSVIVTRADSPLTQLGDLEGQSLALGQVGSATGYYLPLYDLYGSTLSEVRFAATPLELLTWVQAGEVSAGSLSRSELNALQGQFPPQSFRVIHSSRPIPPGAVLISPRVDRNQQELIVRAMNGLPPSSVERIGYIPNAPVPDYRPLIELIRKVKPIESNLRSQPVRLFPQ